MSVGNSKDYINDLRSSLKGSKYYTDTSNIAVYCCSYIESLLVPWVSALIESLRYR